ncbi:hypothetical protein ACHAXR_005683, partial [Thalassiosira sp. AJA248-18]
DREKQPSMVVENQRVAVEATQLLPTNNDVDRIQDQRHRIFSRAPALAITLVGIAAVATTAIRSTHHTSSVFPPGFLWGAATSAYQVEGGSTAGGRGPSIWDTWCQASKTNCNGDTGDVTDDHYHLWKEDIELMRSLGLKAYRFSISWSRILPNGTADYDGDNAADHSNSTQIKGINYEGIEFYNHIVDMLLEYDIEPFITLYHWDLPQALEDRYGGWANRSIIEDFSDYARICFRFFGDRVKYWITINEGWTTAIHGYEEGSNAPGYFGEDVGGIGKPYLVGHHLLLAHARAVEVFRKEGYATLYQRGNNDEYGMIGISNSGDYRRALDPKSEADQEAATRSMEFQLGWMTDPVWLGDYPLSMRKILGARLPRFTEDEVQRLVGSADFLGLNHYSSALASKPNKAPAYGGYWAEQFVTLSDDSAWKKTEMGWNIDPDGAREILLWIDRRYDHPLIFVTENGMADYEPDLYHSIHDDARKEYFEGYIRGFGQALGQGVDLRGYFAWSLLDNFEWQYGFSKRFGIVHVNYTTLVRTVKSSADFYRQVIESNGGVISIE